MVRDPVCGMQLEESNAAGKSEYKGKTYYFCSPSCKGAFDKEPGKYAVKGDTGSGHQMHH
jgi:YHS domain-containing protein